MLRLVTPREAKQLLERICPVHHRPLDPLKVIHYYELMRSGKWKIAYGSPIELDNGQVCNGQHRLLAVALSGEAQIFIFQG